MRNTGFPRQINSPAAFLGVNDDAAQPGSPQDAMELHIPTLALVAVFITVILGGLLLFSWRHDRSTAALAWWGAGYLVGGASFALLAARGAIPDVLSIELANALLLVGYGFLLAGTRAFGRRETPVTVFLIAPLIWLIAMRVPAIADDINLRVIVVSSLQCAFIALVTYELWRERAEPLTSRWPAIMLLYTHMTMLCARMIAATTTPVATQHDFFRSPTFGLIAFGTVLYTIAFAFLLLSMTKERSEMRHKIAALVDSLTGLANRRSFMSDADALIATRSSRNEPLAVLLADLDHFKKINDVFGHAIGDQVLNMFAATLRHATVPGDLCGRLGGEEFAILLPGRREGEAIEVAERIRQAFAHSAAEVGGHAVAATVSIGIAASQIGDLAGLLGRADRALYHAKESGRDRVAAFTAERVTDEAPLVPATVVPLRQRAVAR
jgi:diguanylate cyclase (GGDEF)-like protein